MSTSAVRAALHSFFSIACQTNKVPGVNAVYRAQPWYIDGSTWDLGAGSGSGAVAFLHLVSDRETRLSMPAVAGEKQVDYDVALVVLYQFLIPSSSQISDALPEDAWVGPLDDTIDGFKDLIRSDPTAGTGPNPTGVIFQMGQDPGDLRITRELPRRSSGKVLSWNVLEFNVTEVITA